MNMTKMIVSTLFVLSSVQSFAKSASTNSATLATSTSIRQLATSTNIAKANQSAQTQQATPDDLAQEKQLSAEYLDKMAAETDAKVIEKNIVIRPIFESGSNQFAKVTDTVKVMYHLVDREGKVVDESVTADELAVFPLNKLIKCWQIAIPQISIGSLYKISCPSDVAYGDKGTSDGAIKPGAALTFRLTVFGIQN